MRAAEVWRGSRRVIVLRVCLPLAPLRPGIPRTLAPLVRAPFALRKGQITHSPFRADERGASAASGVCPGRGGGISPLP